MTRHKLRSLLLGLVLLAGAAGCYAPVLAPQSETAAPAPTAGSTLQPATPASPLATATRSFTAATLAPAATEEATVVDGTPAPTPFDPALQQMVRQAQADLAGRLGVESREVEVVEVQPVTWPDGGLGCPQPGMVYTQVQVDGMLIRLQAAGRTYDYHSGGTRPPFLCEQGQQDSPQ